MERCLKEIFKTVVVICMLPILLISFIFFKFIDWLYSITHKHDPDSILGREWMDKQEYEEYR
jgi:hypothetical protein